MKKEVTNCAEEGQSYLPFSRHHGSLLTYAMLCSCAQSCELAKAHQTVIVTVLIFSVYVPIKSCAETHVSHDVVIPICAGEWLCLKNVHLVVAWLPVLEKSLRGLSPHPSFRLLLTCEPHPAFPASLLEACLKVHVLNPKT